MSSDPIHEILPKIRIAVPFVDHIELGLVDLMTAWKTSGLEVVPYRNSGGFLEITRAHMVQEFLESDRTYLVMIDADVVPDHDITPVQLALADRPVVAGWTAIPGPFYPIVNFFLDDTRELHRPLLDQLIQEVARKDQGSLVKVQWVGTGMICLRRDVLAGVEDPFLLPDTVRREAAGKGVIRPTEDEYFCQQVRDAGHDIWVDLALSGKHFKRQALAL